MSGLAHAGPGRIGWNAGRCLFALALVGLGSCSIALAQTGGLSVTVFDPTGAPLPGATVTLSHATGYVRTFAAATDREGTALFPVLRPGPGYIIQVEFPGLGPLRQDGLRVTIDDVQQVQFQLTPGLEERVRVVAERDVIDLEANQSSTKFSQQFISDLPVLGRFYQNILILTPGVQDADGDGNPNVHGSRERDFSAFVGGVRNQDPLTGYWMSNINPNSIEELEVIPAGAGVEFGRAQGGYAVIVQKQGSNEHEGVFELFFRTSKLDGDGPNVSTTIDDPAYDDPDYEWWQPAIQLSGPIVRDRLWYRLSHEHRNIEEPINIITRTEITTTEAWTHADQLTWQVSPRNKLAFSYQSDPNLQTHYGLSSLRPGPTTWDQQRTGDTYSVTWTAPVSPKVLTEAIVAWQDLSLWRRPATTGVRNQCITGRDYLELSQCLDLQFARGYSGSYYRTEEDHSQRFTAQGKATVYGRFWGASHQFKVGLHIENERYFRSLQQTPFGTRENALALDGSPILRYLARVSVPQSDDVRATGTNWGLYIEDQIKPRSTLALTFGLRLDREELTAEGRTPFVPADELAAYHAVMAPHIALLSPDGASLSLYNNIASTHWPTLFTGYEGYDGFVRQMQQILCVGTPGTEWDNCLIDVRESVLNQQNESLQNHRRAEDIAITNTKLSPFLALAWSPGSNGKTAIKLSTGRHYNTIPLIIPLEELEPALTELAFVKDPESQAWLLWSGIQPTLTVRAVDRELETPYQDELMLKVERELWPETSLRVTWIDRRYRDQIQDYNVNWKNGDFGNCTLFQGHTRVSPSPGAGQSLIDPITGGAYTDTDAGDGDGLVDDCAGSLFNGRGYSNVTRPDDYADLYVQNPFWGDVFVVGNFNKIDYQGWVLELTRRHYRSWELQTSYTYSEARGDGEDFFQELGQDPSLLANIPGYQSYDQRHVVKLNVTTITPWGIRFGAAAGWQSGLPYSVLRQSFSRDLLPPLTGGEQLIGTNLAGVRGRTRQSYRTGVRNDQRNLASWNLDLRAAKELRLAQALNAQVSVEVFNVFDDDSYLIYNRFEKFGQQINGVNEAIRRWGRRWQLGFRLAW